jgi:hypothetical protein
MRISDADRARALDELRRHCADGRIGLDAYGVRMAEALAAETAADLAHALRGLPAPGAAGAATAPPAFALGRGNHGGSTLAGGPVGAGGWKLRERLVVLLSVLVVIVGTCLAVLAHWILAIVLVLGWLIGVAQGRQRVVRH